MCVDVCGRIISIIECVPAFLPNFPSCRSNECCVFIPVFYCIVAVIGSSPEEFSGRVEVEVDTPSLLMTLGTVHLCAAVGTARLHAPKDTEVRQYQINSALTYSLFSSA